MIVETLREYCLAKKEVTESMPFDEFTLVFKVCNKMFLLISLDTDFITLKCDPDKAIELRERYPAVIPGYHMNKAQWNTVALDNTIPPPLILEWIDDSYTLIVQKLPKKVRETLSLRDFRYSSHH
ncbi:MAG: MmcQ/YjbR family DNA-binding protein [Prevotellaceae bacterium]|jgi:predicted DNA-binding protein (MmcQ/YjbR family)|nr:MmcQ/YjbR family DNA-binding protein [Prevotellaceae bacterium]